MRSIISLPRLTAVLKSVVVCAGVLGAGVLGAGVLAAGSVAAAEPAKPLEVLYITGCMACRSWLIPSASTVAVGQTLST